MAENKKSFIAYSDWHGMFNALPDDVAGRLIKHIFSYVNDQNPKTDDFIINALFEQIKATLKRDLQKWEKERGQRSEAGKRSAELRATKFNERSNSLNETQRKPTVSDNVSVSDNVNENNIKKGKHLFKNSIIFDKVKFAEQFPAWDKDKLKHYYESANDYSESKGAMYKDWVAAIRSWERKDAKNKTGYTVSPQTVLYKKL